MRRLKFLFLSILIVSFFGCEQDDYEFGDIQSPTNLVITADTEDKVVMGIEHKTLPIYGVQFHPESIATDDGHQLLRNFLDNLAIFWNHFSEI